MYRTIFDTCDHAVTIKAPLFRDNLCVYHGSFAKVCRSSSKFVAHAGGGVVLVFVSLGGIWFPRLVVVVVLFGRSVGRSFRRSVGRSVGRSFSGSLGHSLVRSLVRPSVNSSLPFRLSFTIAWFG